jgi:uncharacterized protein (TIGR02118 family)
MIKAFSLMTHRPDRSESQFHEHWATTHRAHALKLSTMRRYVQFHVTEHNLPGFPASIYDGIPEVWWDDVAAFTRMTTQPEYTDNIAPDERAFVDLDHRGRVFTREHVRIAGPGIDGDQPGIKGVLLLARSQESSAEAFESWLQDEWAALVAGLPGVVRHIDCIALSGADAPRSDYDLVTELWWMDRAGLAAATAGLDALSKSLAVSPVDGARSASLVGEELRVIWPERCSDEVSL